MIDSSTDNITREDSILEDIQRGKERNKLWGKSHKLSDRMKTINTMRSAFYTKLDWNSNLNVPEWYLPTNQFLSRLSLNCLHFIGWFKFQGFIWLLFIYIYLCRVHVCLSSFDFFCSTNFLPILPGHFQKIS